MIITVTLNPAIDKTSYIDPLVLGGLNRVKSFEVDAGGKGINVSKVVSILGGHTVATGYIGADNADFFTGELAQIHCDNDFIKVPGSTRTNLKIQDEVNGITEINEAGIMVSKAEEQQLIEKLLSYAGKDSLFILAGSMHKNAPPEFYKTTMESLKKKDSKVFLDADGPAFKLALEAKPNCIKPNKEELLRYYGKDEATQDELIALCKGLTQEGIDMVVLSMGASGAIFVQKEEAYAAMGLRVPALSTVGAGDSMAAAFAYATNQCYTFEQAAVLAIACSAGAVTTKGTTPPSLEMVNELKKQVVLNRLW